MKSIAGILPFVVVLALLSACSSTFDATNKSAEEIFARALKEYNDNDMFEAQRLFDLIRLQHPTSQYVDDAQFYLAEVNFRRKEYIMAAYNYNYLRRMYAQSSYAQQAMYKAAMCYVELSPPYDRDQKYTREAIVALTEYRERYKQDSVSTDSLIRVLRGKLAERDYRVAEQYRVLYSPRASITYYDAVIDEYPDTEFCELSLVGKAEVLIQLKRYDEALSVCLLYTRSYPNGKYRDAIESLKSSLPLNDDKARK